MISFNFSGQVVTDPPLEMIPSGVGGDKEGDQEFAGMIIDGEQQGLLFIGGPPLVDGGIVLSQFIDA